MTAAARDYPAISARIAQSVLPASGAQRMRLVVDALWDGLHKAGVSWVGFYLDRPAEPPDARLVLGPCRDKPACSPIGLHGACGQALRSGKPLIVKDVRDLGANYVACDPRDRSEVVIPCFDTARAAEAGGAGGGGCWGVLDLDSWEIGAFDARDVEGLEALLRQAQLSSRAG